MDINLEGKSYENVIIHVGINDIIQKDELYVAEKERENLIQLKESLTKIKTKCRRFGIKNIFFSGLVILTRVILSVLDNVQIIPSR